MNFYGARGRVISYWLGGPPSVCMDIWFILLIFPQQGIDQSIYEEVSEFGVGQGDWFRDQDINHNKNLAHLKKMYGI